MDKEALHLCMGSACHQLGGFRLIPILQELLRRHGLEDRVELKGAFCLETCNLGRSLRLGDEVFTGLNEESLATVFAEKILPRILSLQAGAVATSEETPR